MQLGFGILGKRNNRKFYKGLFNKKWFCALSFQCNNHYNVMYLQCNNESTVFKIIQAVKLFPYFSSRGLEVLESKHLATWSLKLSSRAVNVENHAFK